MRRARSWAQTHSIPPATRATPVHTASTRILYFVGYFATLIKGEIVRKRQSFGSRNYGRWIQAFILETKLENDEIFVIYNTVITMFLENLNRRKVSWSLVLFLLLGVLEDFVESMYKAFLSSLLSFSFQLLEFWDVS